MSLRIDVPASSANLGPGFDALALALELANVFTIEPAPGLRPTEISKTVRGEGAESLPRARNDRFTAAFQRVIGEVDHGWRVEMVNAIPLARGLGSSAAATVAGLVAGRALGSRTDLSNDALLAIATELEGHPENAAASLFGGFVVAVMTETGPSVVRFEPPDGLQCVLFIPDRHLSTAQMRGVLPKSVPHRDAVRNVGRAALGVAAFATGRLDLLGPATEDLLHEPYRAQVYPELPALIRAARDAGALGACLSGAGSTVIAFADDPVRAARVGAAFTLRAAEVRLPGRSLVVSPRSDGIRVR